jgi:hypothetical protein
VRGARNVVAPADGRTYVTYAFGSSPTVVPAGWEVGEGVDASGPTPELFPSAAMMRCIDYMPHFTQAFNDWYALHVPAPHGIPTESESYVYAEVYGVPSFGPAVALVLAHGQTWCRYMMPPKG